MHSCIIHDGLLPFFPDPKPRKTLSRKKKKNNASKVTMPTANPDLTPSKKRTFSGKFVAVSGTPEKPDESDDELPDPLSARVTRSTRKQQSTTIDQGIRADFCVIVLTCMYSC